MSSKGSHSGVAGAHRLLVIYALQMDRYTKVCSTYDRLYSKKCIVTATFLGMSAPTGRTQNL
jgi:hypothetical protein